MPNPRCSAPIRTFLPQIVTTRLDGYAAGTQELLLRLVRGCVWNMAGNIFAQLSVLASGVLVARVLGAVHFGEFGIINTTLAALGVFAGVGLGVTGTRYVAVLRHRDPVRIGRIVALLTMTSVAAPVLVAIAASVGAATIAAGIHAPHLLWELRIGCVLLLVTAISGSQTGMLTGFEAFSSIARLNVLRGCILLPAVVLGASRFQVAGAVGGTLCAQAVVCIAGQILLRRQLALAGAALRYREALREWRVLVDFALPSLLSSVLVALANWLTSAMLVATPGGYVEMGLLNVATQWRIALLFLPVMIGQAATPILSSIRGVNQVRQYRTILLGSILTSSVCVLPLAAVLIALRGRILALHGPAFESGGAVFAVTCITMAVLAIQIPVGNMVVATGRMWTGAAMNAGWAAVLVFSAHVLMGRGWGAMGAAAGFLIAYIAHAIWTIWFAVRVSCDRPFDKESISCPL